MPEKGLQDYVKKIEASMRKFGETTPLNAARSATGGVPLKTLYYFCDRSDF